MRRTPFALLLMASLAAAFLFDSLLVADAPETPLSLNDAVSLAVEANPGLAAARLRDAVDRAGIDVARERPNPELRYEAERETPRQSLSLGIPMELGGKRGRRIDVARAVAESGRAEVARVVAKLRNDVRRAFYGLATAERRADIAREIQDLASRARRAAKDRFDAGDVSRLEVLQADLAFYQAEGEALTLVGELGAARAELNTLIGRDPRTPTAVVTASDESPLPEAEAVESTALAGNAELLALDRSISEAQARAALARAEQIPDPTLEGAVTRDSLPEFMYGWRAAVAVTVPLFTRHRAEVHVEEAMLTKLRAERAALVQTIRGDIAGALAHATAERQQYVRYRDEILPRTKEVEAMAEDSYRSGQTNLVALLQALRDAREVRTRTVQAAYDYEVALADLERAALVGPTK